MRGIRIKLTVFFLLTVAWICLAPMGHTQSARQSEFISLDSARPILDGMNGSLPPDLMAAGPMDATHWAAWVERKDHEVRDRLIRGEEDTLVNLLRFGVTFTSEYRIDDDFLASYGSRSMVNAFADNRSNDLIRAWTSPHPSEGLVEMRSFVEKRGHSLKTGRGASGNEKISPQSVGPVTR